MCTLQHREHDWHFAVPIQGTCHDSRVVRFDLSQADSLATILSRAIQNEPNFKYLIPDELSRDFSGNGLAVLRACGFRVQGAGQIPGGGPNFWALMT